MRGDRGRPGTITQARIDEELRGIEGLPWIGSTAFERNRPTAPRRGDSSLAF